MGYPLETTVALNSNGDPIQLAADGVILPCKRKFKNDLKGISLIRDFMTNKIMDMGLKRPKNNKIIRNYDEIYDN